MKITPGEALLIRFGNLVAIASQAPARCSTGFLLGEDVDEK